MIRSAPPFPSCTGTPTTTSRKPYSPSHRTATVGPQEEKLDGASLWVLPNPSGLNAHYQQPALTAAYEELRRALPPPG